MLPVLRARHLWAIVAAAALLAIAILDGAQTARADSIQSPDSEGLTGQHTSLALDANGFPVVSYMGPGFDLKVMHCNDPRCAGGDESITLPDTVGNVGFDTSLVLDASGFPVIAYHRGDTGELKVMHCNDQYCAGDDESITAPDTGRRGSEPSLALDASGFPVIAYHRGDTGELKVMTATTRTAPATTRASPLPTPPATSAGTPRWRSMLRAFPSSATTTRATAT
ncbi:MAG: hypothetical protein GEU28_11985 [Dehalococcoidia bacterium]|nr:hypothetical protein [Dehalococcoidia bacterium]